MTNDEKLILFKNKYEKNFDQALTQGNKKKAHQIIEEWQREYANQSNNKKWRVVRNV